MIPLINLKKPLWNSRKKQIISELWNPDIITDKGDYINKFTKSDIIYQAYNPEKVVFDFEFKDTYKKSNIKL